MGSTPYAIAVQDQTVYLGGDFTGVMAGMPQDTYVRIARWDGTAWSPLGKGLNGTVRAILVVGLGVRRGRVLGGRRQGGRGATGPLAKGVAVHDPATGAWSSFGSGIGEGLRGVLHGEALAHDPAVGTWVGGTFNTAGTTPSCSIALWTGTKGHA